MPYERNTATGPAADQRKLVALQIRTRLAFSRKLAAERNGNDDALGRANLDLKKLTCEQTALIRRPAPTQVDA